MERELTTPPGDSTSHFAPEKAPADSDRSFFVLPKPGELVTPRDELTGLPLPLLPSGNWMNPDWHHHFHPRRSPLLAGVAGYALRNARLQRADYQQHHHMYHRWYYGPELPDTEQDIFALTVMAVAGYMPNHAIAFKHGEPRVVKLWPDVRKRLQTSGEIKVGSREAVNKFMREYVLQQDIEELNVNTSTIDEFLHTKNFERRRVLGHTLLALYTDKAAKPVDEVYFQARKQDLILPNTAPNAQKFIKSCLGIMRIRDKLVHQLHHSLATS